MDELVPGGIEALDHPADGVDAEVLRAVRGVVIDKVRSTYMRKCSPGLVLQPETGPRR
jgi:hypothetical protein